LYKCDLSGNILESFKFDIEQAEGVSVTGDNNIYIISDKEEKLFYLQFDQ